MKIIHFLGAADLSDRTGFQHWYQEACVGLLAKNIVPAQAVAVNAIFDPSATRPRRMYESAQAEREYDIVAEFWLGDERDVESWNIKWADAGLGDRVRRQHSFRVDETVILDRGLDRKSGKTPGIKYIGRHLFHEDLPISAVKRSWGIHAELAVQTFVRLERYVQNIVEETLTRDTPPTRGMPQLYFPTVEDFMVTPEGGQDRITHDLRHLVKTGIRLYAHEYVLR